MTQHCNYQELILLERDIDKQRKESPAFALFNRDKISSFYKRNQQRLSIAQKRVVELMDKYIVKDENGIYASEQKDGQEVYKFNSPEEEQEYTEKYNDFMCTSFEVFI